MAPDMAEPKTRTLPPGVLPTGTYGEDTGSRAFPVQREEADFEGRQSGVVSRPQQLPTKRVEPPVMARALVDQLMVSPYDTIAPIIRRLLPLGHHALDALTQSFPGPLWFSRFRPHHRLPYPDEVSAIAAALATFRLEAVPYLCSLLKAKDAETRCYAAMVCNNVHHPDILHALVRTAVDRDPQCRRVSLYAMSRYRDEPTWEAALSTLRDWANSSDEPSSVRKLSVSALTQLRDGGSVYLFVELLGEADRSLGAAARVGLRILTAHDFGFVRAAWLRWLAAHGREPRVQWLIAGLVDPRRDIRALSAEELSQLAPGIGTVPANASHREYAALQQRYRDWWHSKLARRATPE